MSKQTNTIKNPMSEDKIFKYMMTAVFLVAALFFVKNIIGKAWSGAIVIGVCLVIFSIAIFLMKKLKIAQKIQQLVLCLSIVLLVFCISLNSGNYYSDDFPLYLAVIALSGLYLVPKYTLIQAALIDVLLIAAYFIHPEKADPFSQYIMCVVILTICAVCFYMVINRGRSYIRIGERRTKEAEKLLLELKDAGEKLQANCEHSLERVSKLEKANERLESSIDDLRDGSSNITQGTVDVSQTFDDMQEKMLATQEQVSSLNSEVKKVENSLADSKKNMKEMNSEMISLKQTLEATNTVFTTLQDEIKQIVDFTQQLNKIANSTNTLALNASIEAARAGQMGAGFAVVAGKVQVLAEDSNKCSAQIANVVNAMESLIHQTSKQLSVSHTAVDNSIDSLNEFQDSFKNLTSQFKSLYRNIEDQNDTIRQMDHSFAELRDKISDMASSSEENQNSVNAITDSIDVYKYNINKIVDDNIIISQLSASLLESANQTVEDTE